MKHIIIVAGKTRGVAEGARDVLDAFDIGINDAANGVFLPRAFHRALPSKAYYQAVTNRVAAAGSIDEAMDTPWRIATELAERATP